MLNTCKSNRRLVRNEDSRPVERGISVLYPGSGKGKRANQVRAFCFDFSVSPISRYLIPKPNKPVRDADSK